jgi:hypothetical protein
MAKFGKELIESLQQAVEHAAGRKVRGLRVSEVERSDELTGKALIEAMQASPHRDLSIEPRRTRMPVRKTRPLT